MKASETINSHFMQFARQTLQPLGWIESCMLELPVDAGQKPLPWWTYPAIEFIDSLVRPDYQVFEYGGGHSTLWWSRRVAKVITVDHDRKWVDRISPSLMPPHEMRCIEAGESCTSDARQEAHHYFQSSPRSSFPYDQDKLTRRGLNDKDYLVYANSINEYDRKFDCIVIDGMARRLCARYAAHKLKDNGIIVFDNSNRIDYLEGYQYLVDSGFYQLRLWGSVAGAAFPSCTSVFIRTIEALQKVTFQPSLFGIPEY